MSSSDVLALVAIVVALISLDVTTYEQFLKPAKLEINLGSSALIAYNDEARDSLNAQLSISLINAAARATIVMNMTALLENRDGRWQTALRWHSFYRPVDAGEPGKTMAPWFAFCGYAGPLVARPRDVETTQVFFLSEPLTETLPAGSYLLTITATAQPGVRRHVAASSFVVPPSRAAELRDEAISPVHLDFELESVPTV